MEEHPGSAQAPPGLAIISNFSRPDRVYAHACLAEGIPELKLHSIFIRSGWDLAWEVEMPESIHPVSFAIGKDLYRGWYGNLWKDWRKSFGILRYFRQQNIRAVVLNGYYGMVPLRVIRWCGCRKIPVFIRSDSNIKCENPGGPLKRLLKRILVTWFVRRCAGVMPMGRLGLEYFQQYGAEPDRCFWSPSIPDYDLFASVPEERVEAFRKAEGLREDRRRILFCGRLSRVKRVDLLVDAFARIAGDRPQWDLVIAGDGPLEDDLKRRPPSDLADRVTWLGFRQWEELPPAYALSDVLVLPSEYEPWALVVIEAMAAGMVVITSDIVQAANEICEDGVSGRLFATGSVESLAEALLDVTDPDNYGRYQARVGPALAHWRAHRDPVDWTRRALASVGLLRG